jgi:hypothetical protein
VKYLARLNPRRDKTEAEVIGTLRGAGCLVFRLSGKDVPDLLVGSGRRWALVECKTPGGTLTPGQGRFLAAARAMRLPVGVVSTPEEALEFVKTLRRMQ